MPKVVRTLYRLKRTVRDGVHDVAVYEVYEDGSVRWIKWLFGQSKLHK